MKRRPEGEVRFTVALVSDTHVNEKEDFSASPYPVNAEANPRARHIFAQINQAAPAFTIHLGDMINPVPELPSYGTAVENFNRIAQDLNAPLHLMPGNHDIGDKPVSWMPAGTVNEELIALYEEHFGRHYFSFDHEDCHFVILNSPLINSGIPAEAEQAAWLEADLAENEDKRTFLFSHYPLYVSNPQEPESYDNIDEPGVDVVLDTFDDADRGYFTRTGLVDRRFNPRIAGRLLSALMLRLNEGEWHADPQGRSLRNAKGETLSVLSAGESVPATGIWHCPLTGQTGSNATLDQQPTTRLVVIETPARKSELA